MRLHSLRTARYRGPVEAQAFNKADHKRKHTLQPEILQQALQRLLGNPHRVQRGGASHVRAS